MQKWEYKIITLGWVISRIGLYWFDKDEKEEGSDMEVIARRLNTEGQLGWELISVEKIKDSDYAMFVRNLYLKRLIG